MNLDRGSNYDRDPDLESWSGSVSTELVDGMFTIGSTFFSGSVHNFDRVQIRFSNMIRIWKAGPDP